MTVVSSLWFLSGTILILLTAELLLSISLQYHYYLLGVMLIGNSETNKMKLVTSMLGLVESESDKPTGGGSHSIQ